MTILAIDIGGTMLKIAEVEENGTILSSHEEPSEAKKGGAYLMDKVCRLIEQYTGYTCIGVSTAGQVDSEKGEIIYANENIPHYTGMPIKKMLEERFLVPVAVENDVNAAALGEATYGAGKEEKDFLCLTYGTGIGGAIVIDRKIYKGANGVAGEFGHIITHPGGRLCGCGHKGCYEQYASTTALVKSAQQRDALCTNGHRIFQKFNVGDLQMKEVIDEWVEEVLLGLTTLTHVFNPSCFILGGGVLEQPYIIEAIHKGIKQCIMPSYSDVQIKCASLGNRAGVLGASYLATRLIK